MVEHERNGLMVNCGDHDALAAEALRLLDDPELARRVIGEGLRDVREQYTWDAVRERWSQLYRRLATSHADAPALADRAAAPDDAALVPEATTR